MVLDYSTRETIRIRDHGSDSSNDNPTVVDKGIAKRIHQERQGNLVQPTVQEVAAYTSDVCREAGLEIMGLLGEGTFGVVYAARKGSKKFALKVSKTREASIVHEATIQDRAYTAGVKTPRVFEAGAKDGLEHALMEQVTGISLERETPFSPLFVAGAGASIAESLYTMHEAGIIHRDIKPKNLLLMRGEVYILDFGIALTSTDERYLAGSPRYMAPEGYEKKETPKSDQYSLGRTLHRVGTGEDALETSLRGLTFDQVTPMEHGEGARLLTPLLERMSSFYEHDRYDSCKDVAEELLEVTIQLK